MLGSRPGSAMARVTLSGVNLRITWLGHATVLIELDDKRVLTDPLLRSRVGPLVRIAPPAAAPNAVDAVLLSHLHADHLDLPSLRRLEGSPRIFAPRGAGSWLRRRGLAGVVELQAGEVEHVGSVEIRATAAVHDGRRYPLGPCASPVGYLATGTRSAYFAGDTDLSPHMSELRGQVEVALLPVAGWGPRVGPGHLNPLRAAQAAAAIQPSVAIPIHWGTYVPAWARRRTADALRPAQDFVQLTAGSAPDVEVRLLSPGGSTTL